MVSDIIVKILSRIIKAVEEGKKALPFTEGDFGIVIFNFN